MDTLFEDIVRKFHERSRAGMNGLSSQDEDGRAHTVRLYSSLLHGLTQKGGFYELRDVKVTCTMRRMCDELYTLVKHLRREYVHGHGVLMDVIEERCPSKWLIPKEDDAEELPDADSIGENTVEGTDLYTPQNEETTQHEDNQSESEQPESYQSESRTYYPGFTENESSSEEATETDNITLVSLDFGSLTEGTTPHFPQNESSSEESSSDSRRVETGSDSSEDVPATTQFPLPSRPRHVPKPLIVDYSDSEELPEADVSTSRQHHEPQPRRRVRMPFVVSSSDSEEPQEDRLPSPMNTTEYMPQEEGVSLAPNELFFSPTPDPSHHSSRASSRPVGKFAPLIETVPGTISWPQGNINSV